MKIAELEKRLDSLRRGCRFVEAIRILDRNANLLAPQRVAFHVRLAAERAQPGSMSSSEDRCILPRLIAAIAPCDVAPVALRLWAPPPDRIGEALFPACPDGEAGAVLRVCVRRGRPDTDPPWLQWPGVESALKRATRVHQGLLRDGAQHPTDFHFAFEPADLEFQGGSVGLAALVALVSYCTRLPVPGTLVFSGVLDDHRVGLCEMDKAVVDAKKQTVRSEMPMAQLCAPDTRHLVHDWLDIALGAGWRRTDTAGVTRVLGELAVSVDGVQTIVNASRRNGAADREALAQFLQSARAEKHWSSHPHFWSALGDELDKIVALPQQMLRLALVATEGPEALAALAGPLLSAETDLERVLAAQAVAECAMHLCAVRMIAAGEPVAPEKADKFMKRPSIGDLSQMLAAAWEEWPGEWKGVTFSRRANALVHHTGAWRTWSDPKHSATEAVVDFVVHATRIAREAVNWLALHSQAGAPLERTIGGGDETRTALYRGISNGRARFWDYAGRATWVLECTPPQDDLPAAEWLRKLPTAGAVMVGPPDATQPPFEARDRLPTPLCRLVTQLRPKNAECLARLAATDLAVQVVLRLGFLPLRVAGGAAMPDRLTKFNLAKCLTGELPERLSPGLRQLTEAYREAAARDALWAIISGLERLEHSPGPLESDRESDPESEQRWIDGLAAETARWLESWLTAIEGSKLRLISAHDGAVFDVNGYQPSKREGDAPRGLDHGQLAWAFNATDEVTTYLPLGPLTGLAKGTGRNQHDVWFDVEGDGKNLRTVGLGKLIWEPYQRA